MVYIPVKGDSGVYERIEVNSFDDDEVAEENAGVCAVCLLNRPKVIVFPCFHLCLCLRCNFGRQLVDADHLAVNRNNRSTCPVSRGLVNSTTEVYIS